MCFKDRKKPALIITILSVFVVLCGVTMIVESIIFALQDDIMTADLGTISQAAGKFKTVVYAILLGFACLALVTGIIGTTCGCKPCAKGSICYPVWFGILLFFVWIVTLIVGAIICAISFTGETQLQQFCKGTNVGSDRTQWMTDQINSIDVSINKYSSNYMCSFPCQCNAL
jgi:hypothetical protein